MALGIAATWSGFADRLSGPGGLYNLGIVFFLIGGIGLKVTEAFVQDGPTLMRGVDAAWAHLFGSPSACAISLAMLIFCWSGEEYRRAWKGGPLVAAARMRRADVISAMGALTLAVGLLLTGAVLLAAMAGTLHVLGKIGSALSAPGRTVAGLSPPAFRVIVLASRGPAVFLFLQSLLNPASSLELFWALPLLGTFILWVWADLVLVCADRKMIIGASLRRPAALSRHRLAEAAR